MNRFSESGHQWSVPLSPVDANAAAPSGARPNPPTPALFRARWKFSLQLACHPFTPRPSYRSASQGAISVSCAPGLVSSTSSRIGRRSCVTSFVPTCGQRRLVAARVWHIDMYSRRGVEGEGKMMAQKSTTCLPCVLIILIVWLGFRGRARPVRAGMVMGELGPVGGFVSIAPVACTDTDWRSCTLLCSAYQGRTGDHDRYSRASLAEGLERRKKALWVR